MAIAAYKPDTESPVVTNLPRVENNYDSIIVDNSETPIRSLLTYIQGSHWTVDYYNQITSRDTDIRTSDPGQSSIYQQYRKIEKLDLLVETPISSSQNTDNTLMSVKGSSKVYPVIVPNVGDIFKATLIDGMVGIFTITEVERLSFNKDAVYMIDYNLTKYVKDPNDVDLKTIEDKVIRTYVYSKDRLINGQMPLLNQDQYNKEKSLQVYGSEIIRYLFKNFFNRDLMTLVIPGQSLYVYDPIVLSFLRKIINNDQAPEIRQTQFLNTENDPYLAQPTLFDAILNRDINMLSYVNKEMKLVDPRYFSLNAYLNSIYYTGVQYIVYPLDITLTPNWPKTNGPEIIDPLSTIIASNGYVPGTGISPSYTDYNDCKNLLDSDKNICGVDVNGNPLPNVVYGPKAECCGDIVTILSKLIPTTGMHQRLYNPILDVYNDGVHNTPYTYDVLYDGYYVLSNNFYSQNGNQSVLESLVSQMIKGEVIDINALYSLCKTYTKWNRLEQFYYIPVLYALIITAIGNLY